MAMVPLIQDSAQLQTDTGRQRVQADPDAFGAAQARATGAVAEGLGKVANAAVEIDDNFNEAEARDLDAQLAGQLRKRLRDPEAGYLNQRGRNAVDGRAAVETDIDTMLGETAARASNPRAEAMFRSAAARRRESALGQVADWSSQQTNAYQDQVAEARIQEFIDDAVAAYADPAAVQENVIAGQRELATQSARLGWDPEVLAQRQRQFQSDVLSRTVVSLAVTDPQAADEMYARIRPDLSAQDAGELLTTIRAAQAQARERTTGAVWQALANGEDPRALPEWEDFSSNPLYGREHETFNEYRRQRALSGSANALSIRQSELAGDTLEATGALNPRALMLVTDYATGRLSVGPRRPRQAAPDMTTEQFMAETGMSPQRARAMFGMLNPDDLTRVLTRRNGQSDNTAIDQAYDDIRRVAEPMAQSMGLAVTGSAERTAEQRGAFQAYIMRESRAYVLQNGQRPDDAAVEVIARRALLHVDQQGRADQGGRNYAFEPVPYGRIPSGDRAAIESERRLALGRDPTHAEVERRYAQYLQAQQ